MGESSSSNEPFSMDKMNAELEETTLPRKRKHPEDPNRDADSDESDDDVAPNGRQMEASLDHPNLMPRLGRIIAECEVRRRKCIKRRRMEHGPDAMVDESLYDPDDENSSSSMNESNHRVDYNVVDRTNQPTSSARSMQVSRRREKVEISSWLLLSSVNGGWSYERVKSFFMRRHQIKTIKSKSQQLGCPAENNHCFQAVIKFQSKEDLNRVVADLVRRKVHNKFIFFSFDDMPVSFYDSDSEDDTERRGPWMRIPKGV